MDYVPHVVAWNLKRRCNLECAHCYIAAGPSESAAAELETAECLAIVDQLLAVNPAPLLILSGGEPLLRQDLGEIAGYASANGATVVVGTNGTLLTDERIAALTDAGVRGVAVSVDSLRPSYHDNFRHGRGALADVQAALARLRAARLDFIVQTTVTKGNRGSSGRWWRGRRKRGRLVQLLLPRSHGPRRGAVGSGARGLRGGAHRPGALGTGLPGPHAGAGEMRPPLHASGPSD